VRMVWIGGRVSIFFGVFGVGRFVSFFGVLGFVVRRNVGCLVCVLGCGLLSGFVGFGSSLLFCFGVGFYGFVDIDLCVCHVFFFLCVGWFMEWRVDVL